MSDEPHLVVVVQGTSCCDARAARSGLRDSSTVQFCMRPTLANNEKDREYLVDDFSIADIAHWTWVRIHHWAGVSVDDLPSLRRWMATMAARPACARGVEVPTFSADEAVVEYAKRILVR